MYGIERIQIDRCALQLSSHRLNFAKCDIKIARNTQFGECEIDFKTI